jgi:hypothetical protein
VCGATACVPSNGACTSNADCCAGITCVIPTGAQAGTCAPLPPPPANDGGTSGGPPDGGGLGCASLGQSCATLGCCAGLECLSGTCGILK